ncbi:MAG: hypothetical protein JRJ46_07850 [Deltaproteobacteria bacterium]|nr:hypothetical protein [Deltaproteobacteria bacterium]
MVRYTGEFGVKSTQSQEYIEDLLHNNIKRALTASERPDLLDRIRFITRQGRLYIYFKQQQDTDVDLLIAVVGRTFGISSISPCFRTSVRDKTAVVSVAAKLMVQADGGTRNWPRQFQNRSARNKEFEIRYSLSKTRHHQLM